MKKKVEQMHSFKEGKLEFKCCNFHFRKAKKISLIQLYSINYMNFEKKNY